jgi:2-oxoglutarate ferredoxin oxidoreductase subunit beta
MAELLAQLEGVAFSARVAVNTSRNLMDAKKQIKKAFRYQVEGKGFSFIEALSSCPTAWGVNPLQGNERVGGELISYFTLGVFKDAADWKPQTWPVGPIEQPGALPYPEFMHEI